MTTSEAAIRALEQARADAEHSADADALDRLVGPLGFVLNREQWSRRYRSGGRWQLTAIHLRAIQAPTRPDEPGSAGGR